MCGVVLCVAWYSAWCGRQAPEVSVSQRRIPKKKRHGKLAVFSKVCLGNTIALRLPSAVAPARKTNEADCIVLVSRILNCKSDTGSQKDSKTALIVLRINKKDSFKSETRMGLLKR